MNPSIKKLASIAEKKSRKIIGLMSGTSLDGLDIALCKISGSGDKTHVEMIKFITKEYESGDFDKIRRISSVEQVKLDELCYGHTWLGIFHARLILQALQEWNISPDEIDCIASHGQTIYHLPARDQQGNTEPLNSTLQIADGDQIAARTGILTISDFRQKHTAYHGEGAPMAALVDRILFGRDSEQKILLNIGGIANYTYIPIKSGKKSFTTDTGPGNTLIDNFSQSFFSKPFDEDGKIASSGKVNEELLASLVEDSFFDKKGSKSTGPEYFNPEWVNKRASGSGIDFSQIKKEDVMATLTELSAVTLVNNVRDNVPADVQPQIYISGGGARNPCLVKRIRELLPGWRIMSSSQLGIDPDAKEAVIFAVLANEMLAGTGFSFETDNGTAENINFGKISFPE